MIRYSLVCANGHGFQQWFDSMADYDAKKAQDALICPECGDPHVSKAIMAPNLAGSGGTVGSSPDPAPVPTCGMGGCGGGLCGMN